LEILIALAIAVLTITAVILVSFGGQSLAIDSQTSSEALHKAQEILDQALETSRNSFDSVVNSSGVWVNGITYSTSTIISNETQCGKQISVNVAWDEEHNRHATTTLTSLLTNVPLMLGLGGDCSTVPPGPTDWQKPNKLNVNVSGMEGSGTAIDVLNKIIFLTSKTTGSNKDDFFIIDATNVSSPIKKGFLDLSDGAGGDGLEDIDVAGNYAFVANDEKKSTKQLKVVDVSNLNLPTLVNESSLSGASGTCPNTCPGGRSIYYYDKKIYMGTHRMVAAGAGEFQIFDVSDPTAPVWLGKKGGTALGDIVDHNINDIAVREQIVGGVSRTYAYLATSDDSGELIILNVTNPGSIPDPIGTVDTGSVVNLGGTGAGDLDATKLYIIGNRAYVGRERATGSDRDFYILDISNPTAVTVIGSVKLGLNSTGSAISGIKVSGNLAFIGTTDPNDPFEVWNVSDPATPTRWDTCPINFSTFVTDIEFENNLIYTSMDAVGHNPKILEPTGGTCI